MLFGNTLGKTRKKAKQYVLMANKVRNYRRDVVDPKDLARLDEAQAQLEGVIKDPRANITDLENACARVDTALRPVGGDFYPVTFWADNTETFLVAALVVFSLLRCFVVQPFKIPTNSMYPTYSGVTTVVNEQAPSLPKKVFEFFRTFATNNDIISPADGEVLIPIDAREVLMSETASARDWLVLPGLRNVYTLYVDKTPVQVVLPIEHRADQLFLEAFFPELDKRDPSLAYRELAKAGKMQGRFLHTGKFVKKGERIFNFDIRTGDLLLVDRMRYHFTSPKIGDPVVFPTKKVPGLGETEDVYYIKRLVGLPGDELEVKGHTLYRNGQPIEGAPAFDLNAQQIGEYPGYKAEGRLAPGRKVTVPPNHYFVMGDNSPMSLDGRLWHGTSVFSNQNPLVGFVPEKEIIGRAVVILYPFSNRFGLAK